MIATYVDDISECREPDLLPKERPLLRKRFRKQKAREGSFVHVGMEVAQGKDFSVTSTQEDFTGNLKLLPTSPERCVGRKNSLSMADVKLRQRKCGELCWVATVARPDFCARVAKIAPRINALCGEGVFRTNELVRVAKERQHATPLKYASSPRPWRALGSGGQISADLGNRSEKVHCSSMSLVGRSDAANEDRLGLAICLIYSPCPGPRHILRWTFKPTEKLVKSGLGGRVYALGEMVDHVTSLKDCYGPLEARNPGLAVLGDCESRGAWRSCVPT